MIEQTERRTGRRTLLVTLRRHCWVYSNSTPLWSVISPHPAALLVEHPQLIEPRRTAHGCGRTNQQESCGLLALRSHTSPNTPPENCQPTHIPRSRSRCMVGGGSGRVRTPNAAAATVQEQPERVCRPAVATATTAGRLHRYHITACAPIRRVVELVLSLRGKRRGRLAVSSDRALSEGLYRRRRRRGRLLGCRRLLAGIDDAMGEFVTCWGVGCERGR